MNLTKNWLSSYWPRIDASSFLDYCEHHSRPGGVGARDRPLGEDVFDGVDRFLVSTAIHTARDLGLEEEIDLAPDRALEMATEQVRSNGQVRAEDACMAAESFLADGNIGAARGCSAAAFLLGDRSLQTLLLLGVWAIAEGRQEEADEIASSVERRFPESKEASLLQAIIPLAQGEKELAISRLEEAADSGRLARPAWELLITLELSVGRTGQAAAHSRTATRLFPSWFRGWELLSEAIERQGDTEGTRMAAHEAWRCLSEDVAADPETRRRVLSRLARTEELCGNLQDADQIYRLIATEFPSHPETVTNHAALLAQMGRKEEAAAMLKAAREQGVSHPAMLTNLGELLYELGELADAYECLCAAAEADPTRTRNVLLMAVILLRTGRFREAAGVAESLAQAAPELAFEALLLAGDAHRFAGNLEGARQAYEKARLLRPDHPAVAERLVSCAPSTR